MSLFKYNLKTDIQIKKNGATNDWILSRIFFSEITIIIEISFLIRIITTSTSHGHIHLQRAVRGMYG